MGTDPDFQGETAAPNPAVDVILRGRRLDIIPAQAGSSCAFAPAEGEGRIRALAEGTTQSGDHRRGGFGRVVGIWAFF